MTHCKNSFKFIRKLHWFKDLTENDERKNDKMEFKREF